MWAREHGHQVADVGMVHKSVLEAYDAPHQAPVRKAGWLAGWLAGWTMVTDAPRDLGGALDKATVPEDLAGYIGGRNDEAKR